MIKVFFSILLIALFTSCSTSNKSKEVNKNDDTVISNQIFYLEDYPTTISSFKGDIVLLNEEHLKVLKNIFDVDLKDLLKQDSYEISSEPLCSNRLLINKFDFKEFKIQVDGPSLNVVTLRINYSLIIGEVEKNLYEEVNKESQVAFDELVFKDMCNIAAVNMVKKLNRLSSK